MSHLTLPVYDLSQEQWLDSSFNVEYRNTLLGHLFPQVQFAIGDVLTFIKSGNIEESAEVLDAGFHGYKLVGASSSRKHGRCIFAKSDRTDYFTRFFSGNSHAINYGSNLTTECKSIFETALLLKVVDDGEYLTGDCHGKASASFINHALNGLADNPTATPFQFRACDPAAMWVAKGTIAYSSELDDSPYALVLPASAFKGQKVNGYVVPPGEYQVDRLVFGVVHLAEQRLVNMSYSVTQFLPWSAIESDILPGTIRKAIELNELTSSPRQLAEYLLRTDTAAVEDSEDEESERYVPAIAQLLAADTDGQNNIIAHPWVADKVAQMVRRQWLKLATAGAVRFHSYMVMPDDSLPFGTVCVPDLAEGELIGFPYPCRWKHDINIVQNVHLDSWMDMSGIIVGSTKTMLDLFSRDFDGDFLQVLPADKLPNVAAAVRNFGKPKIDQSEIKPLKRELTGSLGDIAVLSMENQTGLITWLIAKAWASGREDFVEMLVPELQAAVDSLKGAAPPNQLLLDNISSRLPKPIKWLEDYKNPTMYLNQVVGFNGVDSISLLVQAVNPCWIEPKYRTIPKTSFQGLFPAPETAWLQRANLRSRVFCTALKSLDKESPAYGKAFFTKWASMLDSCSPDQKMKGAAALWHCGHYHDDSSSSLVFLAALPQICQQLSTRQIQSLKLVGVNVSDYPEQLWCNERVAVTVVQSEGSNPAVVDRHGKRLGFIPQDSWCPSIGDELVLELRHHIKRNGQPANRVDATLIGQLSF
jgi:hypothetical protein